MKRIAGFTFALLVLLASSCVKDPEPTGGGQSGGQGPVLEFLVTKSSNPVQGAIIRISSNAEDRDNGIFLRSRSTGATGIAEFADLAEATYWYNVKYTSNGAIDERDGDYHYVPGQNGEVRIHF